MTGGNEIFVGRVEGLARYPVKSMAGEAVARSSITATGLEGDRVFAAIDQATGKIASAKRPHLWRGLLACSARLVADGVQITLPTGARGLAGAPAMDQTLSELLRRPVRLAAKVPAQPELDRAHPDEVLAEGDDAHVESDLLAMGAGAPAGTFFDFAAIHLLTTATLDSLSAAQPGGKLEPARYRPNVLVRSPPGAAAFPENAWLEGTLRIGSEVTMQVILTSPRCAIPTLAQGNLPSRPAALRAAISSNQVDIPGFGTLPCAGIYARVTRAGTVSAGDQVMFTPAP